MKKLRGRTWFVLLFTLLLLGGLCLFVFRFFTQGGQWAAFSANQHLYSNGKIASGTITDRNGLLLFDGETGDYAGERSVRRATLHVVGDAYGNIATGAKKLFEEYMISYNPITGAGNEGNQVSLTVDAQVNQTALQALDGKNGAVGVYNYETGEVLCMVSAPTFDPYDSEEVLEAVNAGDPAYDSVYLNRFFSSTFTPGSIFKVVTAAAAIDRLDALEDFHYTCTGSLEIGDETVTCPSVHGEVDLEEALASSCNGAFAQLAMELGGDTLEDYARSAGLLDSVEMDGLSSAKGAYTPTAVPSDLAWSGVGQYTDLVNPCAAMVLMGCIAGNGSAQNPTLLHSVTNDWGLPTAFTGASSTSIGWSASTCQALKALMRNNVVSHYGQDQFGELAVCAKSGTAEVGPDQDPHAWFVGFVDDPEHPYAFAVVVENGGWGSRTAGSVAAQVLSALTQGED